MIFTKDFIRISDKFKARCPLKSPPPFL